MLSALVVDDHGTKKKPVAILYYNTTNGGVNTADEMLRLRNADEISRQRGRVVNAPD